LNVNELDKFLIQHSSKEELLVRLAQTKSRFEIKELLYLSTCNRVVFLFFTEKEINQKFVQSFFSYINPEIKFEPEFHQFIQCFTGEPAIERIFSIASSIDSLVIGEREILRQFREAYALCNEGKLMGDHLRLLEKYIVKTAKEVYSKTKIGNKSVSVVSLAAKKLFSSELTPNPRILMIGAGETNTLFAKFLEKHELREITIFNRSLDNAESICKTLNNSKAYHLKELQSFDQGFDAIIACTASMDYIVTPEIYKNLLQGDQSLKHIIDLAVPNNIDKAITKKHQVNLIDIEELRGLAKENMDLRKNEVSAAQIIIKENIEEFSLTHQKRQIEKQFSQLPQQIREIKERAINQVYKKDLEQLDPVAQKLVMQMMDYMEKKCVAIPIKVAKEVVPN